MKMTRNVNQWTHENWEFIGRQVEERTQEGELTVDAHFPMMLYAYPLRDRPSDDTIREIHNRTNTTVVRNKENKSYYLALTGAGMDLSQDIALAYIIAENGVPYELALDTYATKPLSIPPEDFIKVMEECKSTLERGVDNQMNKIDKALEKYTEGGEE